MEIILNAIPKVKVIIPSALEAPRKCTPVETSQARSRPTGGYMMFYSFGSALGSIASTFTYEQAGWRGVCMLGAGVSAIAVLFWWITRGYQPGSKSN